MLYAGHYGQLLMRYPVDKTTELIDRQIPLHGCKPGWCRLSIPYYFTHYDIRFILAAVEFVADHGEKFVPLYRYSFANGVFASNYH